MIRFDGKHISEISSRIEVLDYTLSAPSVESTRKNKPATNGTYFVRSVLRDRTVTVLIEAVIHRDSDREEARNELLSWLRKTEPKKLELDRIKNKYLIAECIEMPQFYLSGSALNEEKIVFSAEPYFISSVEKSAAVGKYFEVSGDTKPDVVIECRVTDSISNPYWQFDGGKTITLSGTFENTTLVVDITKKTIYQDDTPMPGLLAYGSRYFDIEPGVHKITGTGGTVKWQERWI